MCTAYLPAGWLLSHVFRLRERNTPAVRGRWSRKRRSLLPGLGTAVLVGTVLGLLDRVAGVGWGAVAGLVCWLVTAWSASPADLSSVTSPQELLRQDRRACWGFVRTGALLGLLAGLLLSVLLGYLNGDLRDADPLGRLVGSTVFGCGVGFWSGLVLGLAAALHRTASGDFTLSRLYLAARYKGALPRHLMAFLTDAHQVRGVLRQVGPLHQFRHIDLQRRLARRTETRRCHEVARPTELNQ